MLRSHLFLLVAISYFCSATNALAAEAEAKATAMASITAEEIKDFVNALADDTFEGREAGSRGSRAAGIYITERLKKLGLKGAAAKESFYQPFGEYRNILTLVEGRDEALKDQVIVVSAHYDHVGYGSNRNSYGPIGLIHNGADDNASGVAGLLEVIEAVCRLPEPPKRSILFAFWDGEEKGLLGSKHWVEHPTLPLSRVAMMINADMIGRMRGDRLEVYGTRTSPGLRKLISRQNGVPALKLEFTWDIRPDSDHHSFYARNIPFLMLHTGKHPDYHRPSDDAERINVEGLTQAAQLLFGVVDELAETPTLGGFRSAVRSESDAVRQNRERSLPPVPGRLGVRWDEKAEKDGQIVVTAVTPNSAADKAGVKAGDRFVTFADQSVSDAATFRRLVLAAQNPVNATLERSGASEPVAVTLNLVGQPARLGLSWQTDDAEPTVVTVNRVIPGSAADQAGIRVGERIYRAAGQDAIDGDLLRRVAAAAQGNLSLEVESSGRIRTVEVPLVDLAKPAAEPAGQ